MKAMLFATTMAFGFSALLTAVPAQAETLDVLGSLYNLKCESVFQRQTNERVSVVERRSDGEGATTGMTLKAIWEKPGRQAWAHFKVSSAKLLVEDSLLYITAVSDKGTVLNVNVNLDGEDSEGEMLIDGVPQDFVKLVCSAQLAG